MSAAESSTADHAQDDPTIASMRPQRVSCGIWVPAGKRYQRNHAASMRPQRVSCGIRAMRGQALLQRVRFNEAAACQLRNRGSRRPTVSSSWSFNEAAACQLRNRQIDQIRCGSAECFNEAAACQLRNPG